MCLEKCLDSKHHFYSVAQAMMVSHSGLHLAGLNTGEHIVAT